MVDSYVWLCDWLFGWRLRPWRRAVSRVVYATGRCLDVWAVPRCVGGAEGSRSRHRRHTSFWTLCPSKSAGCACMMAVWHCDPISAGLLYFNNFKVFHRDLLVTEVVRAQTHL